MKFYLITTTALGLFMTAGVALAQQPSPTPPTVAMTNPAPTGIMMNVPAGSFTVTEWYKQNIYDMSNVKLGDITDVLVSPTDGKITALIVGVGGFLGMGEKEIAVSFDAVKKTMKDEKIYLTMNTTKEALIAARGFKYDRKSSTWIMSEVVTK